VTAAHDEDAGPDESIPETVDRVATELPLPVGLAVGLASTVVGYVLFFAVVLAGSSVDFSKSVVNVLRSVGLLYYNAHNVPMYERLVITQTQGGDVVARRIRETWTNQITGWARIHQEVRSGGSVVSENTQTTVFDANPALPAEVYLLIPVLVLLVAGAGFTRRFVDQPAVGRDTGLTSLLVGGVITIGYLLVVLLGTYVLVLQGGTEGTVLHPARFEALVYGLAYPLVFGSLGAYLAIRWQRRDATNSTEPATN